MSDKTLVAITTIEPLISPEKLAEALDVSEQTLRRWWHAGDFPPPIRIGRRAIRWRLSDLEKFLDQKKPQREPEHADHETDVV